MDSGNDSKMVNGWIVLSYCEARIMYMKMMESKNAQMNCVNVRSNSRPRPETVVLYSAGKFISRTAPIERLETIGEGETGSDLSAQAYLALAIQPVDARRAHGRRDQHQIVKPHQTGARARNVEVRDGADIFSIGLRQTQLHVILLVDGRIDEARHFLVAADH